MPLRFCMVTTFYPPYHFGGDAIFIRALCEALVAQGHAVDIVHCEDAFRLHGEPPVEKETHDNTSGIVVHRLHSRFGSLSPLITHQTGMPGLKRPALRRILDKPFDVIHFHNISLVGGPGVLAMGRTPVKFYTAHEHWLVCPMNVLWKNRRQACDKPQCLSCCLRSGRPPQFWRYTGMLRRNLRHIDALLVPSGFTAQRHRDDGITRPIHILPYFAPLEPPPSPPAFSPPTRPHFLYVGRLTLSKGVLDLVEQFLNLTQYDLSIVGEGELLEPLRQRLKHCGHIHLMGGLERSRIVELYQRATALIVPSLGPETFGLVTLEAMACGTPVIVREAGGSGDAVNATGGGVIYHTADELRQAVQRMADDPAWRDSLAQKGRLGYEQRYTPTAHLKLYLHLVETYLASKKTGNT